MKTRYGRLTVIDPTDYTSHEILCRCDCGNTCRVRRYNLINERTNSCGCYRRERLQGSAFPTDLAPDHDARVAPGSRHGRWTVLDSPQHVGKQTSRNYTVRARCDCGTVKDNLYVQHLLSGRSKSCGCLRREGNSRMYRRH